MFLGTFSVLRTC